MKKDSVAEKETKAFKNLMENVTSYADSLNVGKASDEFLPKIKDSILKYTSMHTLRLSPSKKS